MRSFLPRLAVVSLCLPALTLATAQAEERVIYAAPPGDAPGGDGSELHPYRDLQKAVTAADAGATVMLAKGVYGLAPSPYADSTCANCENPDTLLRATRGVRVTGRGVRVVGAGTGKTILVTRAGYGVLFDHCESCALEKLTVTGGERDTSAMASDAAVVVKGGKVSLEGLELTDNLGDSVVVKRVIVGIAGIAARDSAQIEVRDCRITRNSWDGIALYRGVRATIENNWIDGVDCATGGRHGGGRGVGIGCTWDSKAEARGNAVRRYWKGIGAFVNADLTAEENVVEEIATWGLALWDADRGAPRAVFVHNVVYRTGACGVMIWRADSIPGDPGRVEGNLLIETGQNPKYDSGEVYCTQRALALDRVPGRMRIEGNVMHANREPGGGHGAGDVEEEEFEARAKVAAERLRRWSGTHGTSFRGRLGRGG